MAKEKLVKRSEAEPRTMMRVNSSPEWQTPSSGFPEKVMGDTLHLHSSRGSGIHGFAKIARQDTLVYLRGTQSHSSAAGIAVAELDRGQRAKRHDILGLAERAASRPNTNERRGEEPKGNIFQMLPHDPVALRNESLSGEDTGQPQRHGKKIAKPSVYRSKQSEDLSQQVEEPQAAHTKSKKGEDILSGSKEIERTEEDIHPDIAGALMNKKSSEDKAGYEVYAEYETFKRSIDAMVGYEVDTDEVGLPLDDVWKFPDRTQLRGNFKRPRNSILQQDAQSGSYQPTTSSHESV
jgi:hypothetical protein